ADVHRPLEHVHVEPEQPRLLARELEELAARQRLLAPPLALRVHRLAQQLDEGHARNLDRILEAEEQAGGGALMRFEREQVLPGEGHRTLGHLVPRPSAERIAERRLARAVRSHDRMDLARVDGEREALEARLACDSGVKDVYLDM